MSSEQVGEPTSLAFAIEKDEKLLSFIKQRWSPELALSDAKTCDPMTLPIADIWLGGPPCYPFCQGGSLEGLEHPDGPLVFRMVECLETLVEKDGPKPKAMLLENSPNIAQKFRDVVFKPMRKRLKRIGYKVTAKKLCTKDHGVPQNRERLYLLAYRPALGRQFKWPKKLPHCIPVRKLLKRKDRKTISAPVRTEAHKTRIEDAIESAKSYGYQPTKQHIFVDIDCSAKFANWRAEECMTLTRARAMAGGYYVTSLKRRTDTEEMMHLQGISSHSLGDWVPHLSRTDMNAAVGNAMSVNVVVKVLEQALRAVGWADAMQHRSAGSAVGVV